MSTSHYPTIGYDPELKHCAFYFGVQTKLVNLELNFKGNESREEESQIRKEFEQKVNARFPSLEAIESQFPPEERGLRNQFAGLDDRVLHRIEPGRLVTTHQSVPYAPSMQFEVEEGHLQVELHNCATPHLAAIMWSEGLRTLKTIYDAYKVDSSFLPSIKFAQEGVVFRAPFLVPSFDINDKSSQTRGSKVNLIDKMEKINKMALGNGSTNQSKPENKLDMEMDLNGLKGAFTKVIPYATQSHRVEANLERGLKIMTQGIHQGKNMYDCYYRKRESIKNN